MVKRALPCSAAIEHNITQAASTQKRSGSFSQRLTTINALPETEIDAVMAEDTTIIGRKLDNPPTLHHTSKRKSNGEFLDTNPTRQPSAVSPFLRLPAELRGVIYSDVLTLRHNPSPKHRYNIDGSAHTSILRTCYQVWEEASPFLYSNEMTIFVHGEYVYYGAESWSTPVTEDGYCEDPGRWALPPAPAYLFKCKSFKISLEIETLEAEFEPSLVEESALRTITNLNSLVYTILLKLQSLQSIHVVLSIEGEATLEEARLSVDFMLSFERRCLETLGRLQGLKKAKLVGFDFQDPVYIASVKQQMLQPRSQNWTGLSADYASASTALAVSNFNINRRR